MAKIEIRAVLTWVELKPLQPMLYCHAKLATGNGCSVYMVRGYRTGGGTILCENCVQEIKRILGVTQKEQGDGDSNGA